MNNSQISEYEIISLPKKQHKLMTEMIKEAEEETGIHVVWDTSELNIVKK